MSEVTNMDIHDQRWPWCKYHGQHTHTDTLRGTYVNGYKAGPVWKLEKSKEPLLVSTMRQFPTGEIRHIPDTSTRTGITGTSTQGFLNEYDETITTAYAKGYLEGSNET